MPADGDGLPSKDESAWIAADTSCLLRNWPKTLEFNLTEATEEGRGYFIAVRTACSPSGRLRKEAVTGFSSFLVYIKG